MSNVVKIPATTMRYRDQQGIRFVSLDDLLLWLAESEIANSDSGVRALAQGLRGELKKLAK